MAIGRYPFEDEQQDPFESSFFQQPQAASPPPAPMMDAAPAAGPPASGPEPDPFASSFFAQSPGPASSGAAPRSPGASFRSPSAPTPQPREPRPPAAPGAPAPQPFDFSGLMDKVRTSVDPREKAIAQDSLARQTFQQLKTAGHDVKWQGDQLVVDGRPYVIGDGSAPREITQDPNSTSAWMDRERNLMPGTPPTAEKMPPAGGSPVREALQDPNAWRTYDAAGAGGEPDAQGAYAQLAGSLDPNAPREEMEAAIEAAFGHLPGYGGAYKESVMLNGRWFDLVTGYGAPGASWGGLTPKGPSGGQMGLSSSVFGSGGLASSLLSPFGGGSGAGVGPGAVEGARGVELASGLNPSILAYLQQQQPAEPEPAMAPSYLNLLQPSVR